ncbi:SUMO ligase SizA, putative [Talaromyces stipitatus ATCC 10500]|uniref:SUMO ligase SizA, putative n=1 Tax=Talaromyces stipitatus (strain ATCC 10500 / CBS 375.48 / QM 6759 / NRRL 1006) TaxID=441959 RepID=B8MTQ8_TALSN|nr:SUMO ligase SizA, putative [Talaromyces stipitatus ATCC 10500]EED12543.1 SUMO ligase SizA, putative [Talaromyces stipitatus ATCC 10500]
MTSSPDIQNLVMVIKTMTNAQMKDALRSEGLAVSGVKISLQLRLIEYIERLHQRGSLDQYDRIARTLYTIAGIQWPGTSTTTTTYPSQPSYASSRPAASRDTYSSKMPSRPFSSGPLVFKESPFYKILEPLSPTVECKVRESTRDTVELKFTFSATTAQKLQEEPNLRVMVFCAAESGLNGFTRSDIAFPHQVELKANLDDVKANLRGLKNRPGSTRPADITNYIRKRAGYTNLVAMTYALTQKKFYIVVNLVKRRPVEELIATLKSRNKITRDQVLREMRSRAHDADIVATSTVMSLKCPLSTLRIEIPCRSISCTHNQCFDASSFLQLQEQAPTWTCPVCNKSTSFESLQVDQYVEEILHSTSTDVEQVTIEPNGAWHTERKEEPAKNSQASPGTDDDFVEITNMVTPKLKRETTSEPRPTLLSTPMTNTQNGSKGTTPNLPRSSQKRPAPQVVDLTLSDDEEEDELPIRLPKRQALGEFVPRSASQNSFTNGYTHVEDLRSSTGQDSLSLSPGRQSNIYFDL